MENETAKTKELEDGYGLNVYGIEEGTFYAIHIPALVCIVISFSCVVTAIVLSFRLKSYRTFFTWSKSERFVVYLALCDGGYNVAHFVDHLHITIVRDHVYPKELCQYYGFTLAEFITSQMLMVNVVAINAFALIFFRKQIDYGKYDWRLLLWTFGTPFVGAAVAGIAGQLGPNGTFCYFDGVKGTLTALFFTTVPLCVILFANIILYILTLSKIATQTQIMRKTGGLNSTTVAYHKAARAMSLFVAAFFIQWWSMAVFGVWAHANDGNVPQIIFHFVTTFTNIGGILNLGVFLIIRKRMLAEMKDSTTKTTSAKSKSVSDKYSVSKSNEDEEADIELKSATFVNQNLQS